MTVRPWLATTLLVGAAALTPSTPLVAQQPAVSTNSVADSQSPDGLVALVKANVKAPAAEWYLAQLDAMPNATLQRFQARRILIGYYLNYDIDDKLETTSLQMLDLARQLPPDDQKAQARAILLAYRSLASLYANRLQSDSAIQHLKAAGTQLSYLPGADTAFAADIKRYEMIGKPAPALLVDYQVNKAPKAYASAGATVLAFTANWCHSCNSSYPSLFKLDSAYGKKGLQMQFAVTLDGEFKGVKMTPDEEVEANKKYFVGEKKFAFPISIQKPSDSTANTTTFNLMGYPQFFVIDRKGIVRAILVGWDPYGNRERSLKTVVRQLLGA